MSVLDTIPILLAAAEDVPEGMVMIPGWVIKLAVTATSVMFVVGNAAIFRLWSKNQQMSESHLKMSIEREKAGIEREKDAERAQADSDRILKDVVETVKTWGVE